MSPKYIVALYQQHTRGEADRLFAAYQGKQIKVSVTVSEVSTSTMRAIGMSALSMYAHDRDGIGLLMEFPAKRDRSVDRAKNGDQFVVIGTIVGVTRNVAGLILFDCDILHEANDHQR
jgi:hypothetical protein